MLKTNTECFLPEVSVHQDLPVKTFLSETVFPVSNALKLILMEIYVCEKKIISVVLCCLCDTVHSLWLFDAACIKQPPCIEWLPCVCVTPGPVHGEAPCCGRVAVTLRSQGSVRTHVQGSLVTDRPGRERL